MALNVITSVLREVEGDLTTEDERVIRGLKQRLE